MEDSLGTHSRSIGFPEASSTGVVVAVLIAVTVLVGLLSATTARAATNLDVLNRANIQLDAAAANDTSGYAVAGAGAGAGDVNGDGLDDVIIGAPLANAWQAEVSPG
jgi:hypothetical protein